MNKKKKKKKGSSEDEADTAVPLKESPEKSAPSSDGDGPRDEVDAAHEANEI